MSLRCKLSFLSLVRLHRLTPCQIAVLLILNNYSDLFTISELVSLTTFPYDTVIKSAKRLDSLGLAHYTYGGRGGRGDHAKVCSIGYYNQLKSLQHVP